MKSNLDWEALQKEYDSGFSIRNRCNKLGIDYKNLVASSR